MSKVVGQIKYTVEDEVTQQIVDDICCAALEGGINYWCSKVEVPAYVGNAAFASDVISRGGMVIIHDAEQNASFALTLHTFLIGLRDELTDRRITLQDFYDNHDASDADNVIQRALFGEILYG